MITTRYFPGVLWLLPILFGVPGGIVAALIAGTVYRASWWELLVMGVITTLLLGIALFAIWAF